MILASSTIRLQWMHCVCLCVFSKCSIIISSVSKLSTHLKYLHRNCFKSCVILKWRYMMLCERNRPLQILHLKSKFYRINWTGKVTREYLLECSILRWTMPFSFHCSIGCITGKRWIIRWLFHRLFWIGRSTKGNRKKINIWNEQKWQFLLIIGHCNRFLLLSFRCPNCLVLSPEKIRLIRTSKWFTIE